VNGINYYKLKQINFNGAFEYSELRVVEWKDRNRPLGNDFLINPNPATSSLNFILPDALIKSDKLYFEVYNQLGQLVKRELKAIGSNNIQLDINKLESGFYILIVQENNQRYKSRFIKG
jgi:hypothetical protein